MSNPNRQEQTFPLIYADNAATTRISEAVLSVMITVLKNEYGNPSSAYHLGAQSKKRIEEARQEVAEALGAAFNEIYFTSGGTESNNWAIKGTAITQLKKGKKHIISTAFEHHSVLNSLESLKKQGFEITLLDVPPDGVLQTEQLTESLCENTGLVSIVLANNEIGTIQPITELATVCRSRGILFHTDAVQAVGNILVDVRELNVDLLSISGHKIHAPKGVGALYIRKGVEIAAFMDGGAQERFQRAGTENTASIAGLGVAIREAVTNRPQRTAYVHELRERFIDGVLRIGRCRLNGNRNQRLPGNANISFENVEAESLLFMLDMQGICCSTGSACSSGSLDASHVLLAIGLPMELARGSLRFTFSDDNSTNEIDYILTKLDAALKKLRGTLPIV
ncbi:MAG: aminotransferase class V-fold PLP-dependent enzyme [Planctomycetaceae bacterium]|jgi:cysteine desulfurase|nr:aminotransferase class V-fold PLP-dependent enzyme [Planctomycetaceae bacterium]